MGDVIKFPSKHCELAGLLGLPECPVKSCARCGRSMDQIHGWVHASYGCSECSPEMEEVAQNLAARDGHIFLLESALVTIHRHATWRGSSPVGEIDAVLKNHMLRVENGEVVVTVPSKETP